MCVHYECLCYGVVCNLKQKKAPLKHMDLIRIGMRTCTVTELARTRPMIIVVDKEAATSKATSELELDKVVPLARGTVPALLYVKN